MSVKGHPLERKGIPAGYREVLYWRISDRRWGATIVNLLALLTLVLWLFLFRWWGSAVGHMPQHMPQSGTFGATELVLVLVGGLLTLVLHELAHGLAMRAFRAPTQFGVLWNRLMVFASAPGHAFPRSAYLLIGLAPLVGLSLLAMLGMSLLAGTPWVGLLVLCAAGNAAAASGDLWIVSIVLRYPPSAYLIDERDGVRILLPT